MTQICPSSFRRSSAILFCWVVTSAGYQDGLCAIAIAVAVLAPSSLPANGILT